LNFGLRRWVGNRQAANLAVGVAKGDGGLVGSGRLNDRRGAVEPNLAARRSDDCLPVIGASVALQGPLRDVQDKVPGRDRSTSRIGAQADPPASKEPAVGEFVENTLANAQLTGSSWSCP
jgi:hypothetical protein